MSNTIPILPPRATPTTIAGYYSHVARDGYSADEWAALPPVLRPVSTPDSRRTRKLVAIPIRHGSWGTLETLMCEVEVERSGLPTYIEKLG